MELYLVRHGETDWNLAHKYYGITDIPLNNTGICQAKEVGEILNNIEFDVIYTSPLIRAIDTCNYIAEQNKSTTMDLKVKIEPKLMEQNLGYFEGYTYKELQTIFPKELKLWDMDYRSAPHGGECFQVFYERIKKFCLEELQLYYLKVKHQMNMESLKKLDKRRVLVVSHMSVLRCMMVILLKMKEDSIWNFTFEQGSYSKIDIEDGYAIIKKINQR